MGNIRPAPLTLSLGWRQPLTAGMLTLPRLSGAENVRPVASVPAIGGMPLAAPAHAPKFLLLACHLLATDYGYRRDKGPTSRCHAVVSTTDYVVRMGITSGTSDETQNQGDQGRDHVTYSG